MFVLRNRLKNIWMAKSDQRCLLPSAVLKGELFGQVWSVYQGHRYTEQNMLTNSPIRDGVVRAENQLLVVALCFLSGGVNGSSFLLENLPCFHLISWAGSFLGWNAGCFSRVWGWELVSCFCTNTGHLGLSSSWSQVRSHWGVVMNIGLLYIASRPTDCWLIVLCLFNLGVFHFLGLPVPEHHSWWSYKYLWSAEMLFLPLNSQSVWVVRHWSVKDGSAKSVFCCFLFFFVETGFFFCLLLGNLE